MPSYPVFAPKITGNYLFLCALCDLLRLFNVCSLLCGFASLREIILLPPDGRVLVLRIFPLRLMRTADRVLA